MVTDRTTESTSTPVAAGPKPAPKSSTITLTANGATMQIVAERKGDGAKVSVVTTDANKKSARGLTESVGTFEAAKATTEKLAAKAEKLGWVRRAARRGFMAKADDFSTLPAPPAAAKAKK